MAGGGEDRLLTLYADVHYYFSEPGPRPAQHRFDKESYVYLYREKQSGRARIEVANHAGTSEQDAFTGYLDNAKIEQSFRHPNLCTLTVNGIGNKPLPDNHWRLPSTDPRDEGNYLFKLHTIDMYFWTEADAAQFVHALSVTLRQEQLHVEGMAVASPAAHEEPMSPVVQNLENMAISHDSNGGSRGQQMQSDYAKQKPSAPSPSQSPTIASPVASPAHQRGRSREEHDYTPLAYNPAAPAAPEKIAHREKTPPPPEGDTGLEQAAMRDQGRPYAQKGASFGPTATPSFGPGAPSTIGTFGQHGISSPTTHTPQALSPRRQNSTQSSAFSPAPSSSSGMSHPMSPSSRTSQGPSFPGPPSRTTSEGSAMTPTPTSEILGPNFSHSSVPLQHLQPQYPDYLAQRVSQNAPPPAIQTQAYRPQASQHSEAQKVPENVRIGGYSDYDYSAHKPGSSSGGGAGGGGGVGYQDGNPYGTGDYSIHQQAYRPTEAEASSHKKHSKHRSDGEARPGKLEQGAEKVEKKVNRFLRGIEKRIG